MQRWTRVSGWTVWVALIALVATAPAAAEDVVLVGLDDDVSVVFDAYDVPTIIAQTEHDAIFMQGYIHARDRLWQMDFQRHLFSGRLAELVGSAAIPQDVQLRTLGLRRAAVASMPAQTPETMAWLEAYAEGVNAYLAGKNPALPPTPEYGGLELTASSIEPWTPLDSVTVAKGLAFGLSFGTDDIGRTQAFLAMNAVGQQAGFFGLFLFLNDTYRSAPFDPTVAIPPGVDGKSAGELPAELPGEPHKLPEYLTDSTQRLVQGYVDQVKGIPLLERALSFGSSDRGSNWFLAAPEITESGFAMLAHDPHLSLDTPSTFHESHLYVPGSLNVTGNGFPGAPGIVLGCNDSSCWGATVNPLDVTDVYQEVVVAMNPQLPGVPSHIVWFPNGQPGAPTFEPLLLIPQSFKVNIVGDSVFNNLVTANVPATSGGLTFVVPRRNFGPIVNFDFSNPAQIKALSIAYTGWGPTTELEAFRRFAKADSVEAFREGVQFFDVGSQNFGRVDTDGNIAYFTSAELPIREDLQLLQTPAGLQGPYLIRDGTHTLRHEWLPVMNPQPHQSLPFEILPYDEMPQSVNPDSGYIINANNDPVGTTIDNNVFNTLRPGGGIYYLSPGYASGERAGRIQRLMDEALANGGKVSIEEFRAFQANNQLLDAEVFTPYLQTAYANAIAAGAHPALAAIAADPRVAEAIGRLADWDFSTPTGIPEGFDPGDDFFNLPQPSQAEIDASVAATIYSVWRGQMVQRIIDFTLNLYPLPPPNPPTLAGYAPGSDQAVSAVRNLLDKFAVQNGFGTSGVNFFIVPGVAEPANRRDIILLGSLQAALNLLASDTFAPAFANSTNQNDYRWGKLHRIIFDHPLGGPFNIPGPGDPLSDVSPALRGVARAGGMGAVDASSHNARADSVNEFMFGSGPARRTLAVMTTANGNKSGGPDVQECIPGGESGVLGSPHYWDQLSLWLVNDYHPLPVQVADAQAQAVRDEGFVPPGCGNGVIELGEECDDSNTATADGCDAACLLECGNGAIEGAEECDDGNRIDGDGCDATCADEGPLLVVLESFTARATGNGVVVEWTTAVELDTVGFRLWRGDAERAKGLTLLTAEPIPARGQEVSGASYRFVDRTAPAGKLAYYLEDIDVNGKVTRHGPVVVDVGSRGRTARRQAVSR